MGYKQKKLEYLEKLIQSAKPEGSGNFKEVD